VNDSFPLVLPYLDGVILAANACEGTYLVIDGFGCHFNRVERFSGNHDLFSTLTDWRGFHRLLTTQAESADLALGTAAKLKSCISRLARGARPEAVFVTPSVTVSISGQQYDDLARELRAEWRVPVLVVCGPILESDWLDGYADTLRAMAVEALRVRRPGRRARRTGRAGRRPAVAVVGNLLARNEFDELANLQELRRLLVLAGLRPTVTWLSGERYRACRLPAQLDGIVALPYGEAAARLLGEALRLPVCLPGLPVGFEGTLAWVRGVATSFGTAGRGLETAEQELGEQVRRFSWAVARFLAGRRAAVCADPHVGRALVPFLRELGLAVELLALESRHEDHRGAAEFAGVPEVLVDPSYRPLRDRLSERAGRGELDLVIGNSHRRGLTGERRVPFLELGVPSYQHHAFAPSPYYGFRGATCLAQRIVNLLNDAG
jgi:nitrogenase molybdenum-iron protein alpha/beta subunit